MTMIDFISANMSWSWVIAGLILLALELVVPGGYLMFLGIAGIVTGLLVMVLPLAWPLQWLIFSGLSLISILVWVRIQRRRRADVDSPFLNQRAERYIGTEGVLDQPILGGFGRLPLGDTIWRISGPDLPVGQRVRIVGADGPVLRVEAVN